MFGNGAATGTTGTTNTRRSIHKDQKKENFMFSVVVDGTTTRQVSVEFRADTTKFHLAVRTTGDSELCWMLNNYNPQEEARKTTMWHILIVVEKSFSIIKK